MQRGNKQKLYPEALIADLFFLALMFLLALTAHAQAPVAQVANWYAIANEGDTLVTTGPAQVQACGDMTHCTPVVNEPAAYTLILDWSAQPNPPLFGTDPLPYAAKRIGVIQTCTAQSFTVNGQAVTVPALPAVACTPQVTLTVPASWLPINGNYQILLTVVDPQGNKRSYILTAVPATP